MEKSLQFIAGMQFQSICSYIRKQNLNDLYDTFTIEIDTPERFFRSGHWEYFHEQDYPFLSELGLRERVVNKLTGYICKELSYELSVDRQIS